MARIELTEDEKKLLRGISPFNVNEKFSFTPHQYETLHVPKKLRPKFTIITIDKASHIVVCRIFDNVEAAKEEDILEMSRKVTVGWENLIDSATGEEIPFKADPLGGCDKATFELLPRVMHGTMLAKAREISGLIGGEKRGLA